LYAQLEQANRINTCRLERWNQYRELLQPLAEQGKIDLPVIPDGCMHNAHMFYIKVQDLQERTRLIAYLKEQGVMAVFHYIPLHSSPAGMQFGRFHGEDVYTTKESERLLRLPMYYGLKEEEVEYIAQKIGDFYEE
jgi:dTDP-4-amino-4,6-dideoxygalactose transaminase